MKAAAGFVGASGRLDARVPLQCLRKRRDILFSRLMRRAHYVTLVLGVAVAAGAPDASAQMVQPIPVVTAPDSMSALSMHLRTLAANPRNLFALLGAGQAALDVGDPNAALGFFARADEINPRSEKAKAGLASALVMLEKADDALRLFGEAVSLGASESDIAKDRGLAYDLRGDNARAQRDYVTALRRGPDDEVTRRYALSLGISGERSQALTMLDPLLRKQDQGAWRARAFILAMNNDVSGANMIARQVMPASLAATMSPFLARLEKLNPAERAHAVNFGTMPSDGQTFARVEIGDPYKSAVAPQSSGIAPSAGLIPSGVPLGPPSTSQQTAGRPATVAVASPATPAPPPAPATMQPGNASPEPGFSVLNVATRVGTRISTRIGDVDPAKLPPEMRGEAPRTAILVPGATGLPLPDAVRLATPSRTPSVPQNVAAPIEKAIVAPPVEIAMVEPPLSHAPAPAAAAPITTISPLPPVPVVEPDPAVAALPMPGTPTTVSPAAAPQATVPPLVAPVSRLASILTGIEPEPETAPVALPSMAEIRAQQRAAARKTAIAAEAEAAAQLAKDEKAKNAAAAKANPARLWVQVATGSNERSLGTTWRKIRGGNTSALKSYGGYSVPYKATNRVLAGPVKSAAEAKALVNALAKAGVSATTYSSEAGQEVVKLAAR